MSEKTKKGFHIHEYLIVIFMLLLAALCHNGINKCNDLLVYFVCLEDRVDHDVLRNFLCASLDHDNFLSCGRNGKSKIRYLLLSGCRVDNELAVNKTYLGHSHGPSNGISEMHVAIRNRA